MGAGSEILGQLDRIEGKMDEILALLRGGSAAPAQASGGRRFEPSTGGQIASDASLDMERGDPTVKKDPKNWNGDSFQGSRFSECPPEYLDALAKDLDSFGDYLNEKGRGGTLNKKGYPETGKFPHEDAGKARAWAIRQRNGGVQRQHDEDEIPTFG